MGYGDAAVRQGEVHGAGGGVEGYGADWEIGVCGVGDAAVDFHVGFRREEGAAVGVDGVGCSSFVGGEDGKILGEEGGLVDVEKAGTWRGLGWVCGGGRFVGEVVFRVRGFIRDGWWNGTPDLWGSVLGRSVGCAFGGRERLLSGVHCGIWKRWEHNDKRVVDGHGFDRDI